MKISAHGLDLIKKYEGFRATVYRDAAGHRTIGYGHKLKPGERFTRITKAQATELLRQDVRVAERAVNDNVRVRLNQNRFDALVSWTFNLGGGSLKRSSMLKHVNAREHALVSREMNKWVYAGGKPLEGLARRRVAEAALYLE